MTAFRYWRINTTANNTSWPSVQIGEVEWRTVAGGAKTNPTAITGEKTFEGEGGSFGSAFVNDGDATTGWCSDGSLGLPAAIIFDFGADIAFAELAIAPKTGAEIYVPKDFTVDGSEDAATWTNVATFAGETGYTTGVLTPFSLTGAPATPRLMIAKANLAVASHPLAKIVLSKANMAVDSHPLGRVVYSKANIAIESDDIVPPSAPSRRRLLFVS